MRKTPLFLGGKEVFGVMLKDYTTIKVGGKALAVFPESEEELLSVIKDLEKNKRPFIPLGLGSNVVFSDKGYDGIIVSTRKLTGIKKYKNFIRAYSGTPLSKLVNFYQENCFGGMEFLVGIPASVGGAVIMNAGAFNKNLDGILIKIGVIVDNNIVELTNKQCGFTYRNSNLPSGAVVLYADFAFYPDENASVTTKEYLLKRKIKQPVGNSFGSVFKNNAKFPAGLLIDKLNLKGAAIGGVKISEKHANFIINEGGTADDVYRLVTYVKQKVNESFNITLEEEVRFIGEFN